MKIHMKGKAHKNLDHQGRIKATVNLGLLTSILYAFILGVSYNFIFHTTPEYAMSLVHYGLTHYGLTNGWKLFEPQEYDIICTVFAV